jgi:DNA-binding Lrp family transcriptional regulator
MKYNPLGIGEKKLSLDIKDKKILSLLSLDSRESKNVLAKKVGLSRDAVKYRINNYEKIGLIQGYKTLVNLKKFEYSAYHIFIKLNNPLKEKELLLINRIKKLPYVRAILKMIGRFDLEIAFIARDIAELDKNITEILNLSRDFLQDYELLILSKNIVSKVFPDSFIKVEPPLVKQEFAPTLPDKKDIEILNLISENANLPLFQIADKLKISADSVSYRIKNMRNSGTILKFIPAINYNVIDYNLQILLLNIKNLNKETEEKFENFIKNNKSALWVVKTIGKFNYLIYILVREIEETQDTIANLKSNFPEQIASCETFVAIEEYKYLYFPSDLFK